MYKEENESKSTVMLTGPSRWPRNWTQTSYGVQRSCYLTELGWQKKISWLEISPLTKHHIHPWVMHRRGLLEDLATINRCTPRIGSMERWSSTLVGAISIHPRPAYIWSTHSYLYIHISNLKMEPSQLQTNQYQLIIPKSAVWKQ